MAKKLASMRESYELSALDRSDIHDDPLMQFKAWFAVALDHQEVDEANAMVLSTASADLQPSSRVVLLKDVEGEGFVFYTNYLSRKGDEMAENAKAALNFWWSPLQRQVRIEGLVSKVSSDQSDDYFKSRPIGSQQGAIASPQSAVISSREQLEEELAAIRDVEPDKLERPDHWGGYRLIPHYFEFWQGRANRLHDRFAYRLRNNRWHIDRLAP